MKNIKRIAVSLAALLLLSGAAMAAPPSARADTSGDSSTGSPTTEQENQLGSLMAQQFKLNAKLKLEEARANAKVQTEVNREKACNARKTALENRMAKAVTQAKKHEAVFDKIYSRVKTFYVNKKLNVTDYAALTAKVDAAQTAATTSIASLEALDVNVDCTSQTVADSVSAFQQALGATRDSLKTYRTALTDLINSLKGASTGTDSSSSDNTNSTGSQ